MESAYRILLLVLLTLFYIGVAVGQSSRTDPRDFEALNATMTALKLIDPEWSSTLDWNQIEDPCGWNRGRSIGCQLSADSKYNYRIISLSFYCPSNWQMTPTAFPEAINNLTALQSLSVSYCPVSTFPDLSPLTKLVSFKLSSNPINFVIPTLPDGIQSIALRDNPRYRNLTTFPASVTEIEIYRNNVSDISSLINKTTYPNLKTLKVQYLPKLDVSTLPLVTKYPAESVSNIETLNLDSSRVFNGSRTGGYGLLSFIAALGSLHKFSCGSCSLYGPLPSQLPSNISYVYLNSNYFTGNIPNSWADLKQLRMLYVAFNELNGNPPDWIQENQISFSGYCNNWDSIPSWCKSCGGCGADDYSGDGSHRKVNLVLLIFIPIVLVIIGLIAAAYYVWRKRSFN